MRQNGAQRHTRDGRSAHAETRTTRKKRTRTSRRVEDGDAQFRHAIHGDVIDSRPRPCNGSTRLGHIGLLHLVRTQQDGVRVRGVLSLETDIVLGLVKAGQSLGTDLVETLDLVHAQLVVERRRVPHVGVASVFDTDRSDLLFLLLQDIGHGLTTTQNGGVRDTIGELGGIGIDGRRHHSQSAGATAAKLSAVHHGNGRQRGGGGRRDKGRDHIGNSQPSGQSEQRAYHDVVVVVVVDVSSVVKRGFSSIVLFVVTDGGWCCQIPTYFCGGRDGGMYGCLPGR